ncbi:Y-family DNA polymerase [Paralcaligenes ginsengisoli]
MHLWISIYLPTHSLDALFPHWPINTPLAAVLRQEKVWACTSAAQALGVRVGMRRSSVLGLAPRIVLRNDDPRAEQHYLQQIALSLLQYTPCLAFFDPHTLVLDVSASLRLFNGPRALWRRLASTLHALETHACLGMAPTARGACLLARQTHSRRRRVLRHVSLQRLLDPLPAGLLPATQTYAEWLQGIGCQTLGQLRQLPRKGLQQRSEPALVQTLDAAYGAVDDYFNWFEAPDRFSQRHDLLERIEYTPAVFHAATRLIEQLCGWLQAKHGTVTTLCFGLHHEKGRHARPPTLVNLKLSEPAWQPGHFEIVLGEQLRSLSLPAPVIAIELEVAAIEARQGLSQSLFIEPAQWPSQERRLFDILRARLGAENVLHAHPLADYRPERANRWESVPGPSSHAPANRAEHALSGKTGTLSSGMPPQLPDCARPFWLLPEPLALETRNNHPVYKGASLRLVQGPERIETGWWDEPGQELRDYFIAQDVGAARYWIYQDRRSPGWFLQGFFA